MSRVPNNFTDLVQLQTLYFVYILFKEDYPFSYQLLLIISIAEIPHRETVVVGISLFS